MTNISRKQEGFSLIEILVSVSVLLIVLGALSSLAVGVSRTSSTNKYQIEAYSQAQQQLELAKQFRNSNILDSDSSTMWDSDENGDLINEDGIYNYTIDSRTGKAGLDYGQSSWSSSQTGKSYQYWTEFDRSIDGQISDSEILNLKTVVRWQEGGNDREIVLRSSLTNWYWNHE